jgi:hypothetical protein
VKASGVECNVRIHDLRHADASWLLAGGFELRSVMDRMGKASSRPTKNTCTPSPTETNATSKPSKASPGPPTPNDDEPKDGQDRASEDHSHPSVKPGARPHSPNLIRASNASSDLAAVGLLD